MKIARPSKELLESIAWHQQQLTQAFTMCIRANYVIDIEDSDGPGRFVIPARTVYETVAKEFKIAVFRKGFQSYVKDLLETLGSRHFRYDGYTFFRGIKRRGICEAECLEESNQYKRDARFTKSSGGPVELGYRGTATRQKTSVASWEKVLAAEGMPGELSAVGLVDANRADMNRSRMELAAQAMWRVHRDFQILRMYLDGMAIIPIAEALGIGRKLVWNRLKHYDLTTTEK